MRVPAPTSPATLSVDITFSDIGCLAAFKGLRSPSKGSPWRRYPATPQRSRSLECVPHPGATPRVPRGPKEELDDFCAAWHARLESVAWPKRENRTPIASTAFEP